VPAASPLPGRLERFRVRHRVPTNRHAAFGIEVRQRVAAPLDQVWNACSSPRGLMNWQADQASGEARKGGRLTLSWDAFGARLELDVVELVPYERIVLNHGESVVELSFDEELVTLRHSGPEAEFDAEGLRSSWQLALAQLAHCVERHPGRKRRVRWFVRRMRCTPEAAYLCFTDARLLGRWLGQSLGIGATGAQTSLLLPSGQRLSGSVLQSVEGRDVALRCESFDDAVLGMRTLPAEPEPVGPREQARSGQRLVALVWSEWGRPRRNTADLHGELGDALRRLSLLLDDCARS
jgi:uncharacterized protein YndB with AHSA1/START domain